MKAPTGFLPLPTTFPEAEARYLLGYLSGESFDVHQMLWAGNSLAGYALYQTGDINKAVKKAGKNSASMEEVDLKAALKSLLAPQTAMAGASFDWLAILRTVLDLISRLV